jgi:hypothetical protein
MHFAAISSPAVIERGIMKAGAYVNSDGRVHGPTSWNSADVIERLLEKGANVNAKTKVHSRPPSPLSPLSSCRCDARACALRFPATPPLAPTRDAQH